MKKMTAKVVIALLLSLGGLAHAQAPSPSVTNAAPSVDKGKTPKKFERAERLEEMRYRHLWIAYGFIWFLVFFFMFRTHKLGRETSKELDELRRRLAELEASDGAG